MKYIVTIALIIFLVLFSFIIVRVVWVDNDEKITAITSLSTMTISFSNVDWGENIRGFPFPIISVPYTHNSSSIPNIYLGYNVLFYLLLIFIISFLYSKK